MKNTRFNKVLKHTAIKRPLIALGCLIILIGIFCIGYHAGITHQKNIDKAPLAQASLTNSRTTVLGTIKKVSSSSVEIRITSDSDKKYIIDKKTVITSINGKTITANDLKNDQRLIITSTTGSNDSLTAERIRAL